MKLSWLKPNGKGLAILASVFFILALLSWFFGWGMPATVTHHQCRHYSDGSIIETYEKGDINWRFVGFCMIVLVSSYPISMCIGASISSRPGLTLCSVSTAIVFFALAIGSLALIGVLETAFSLPRTFYLILIGILSLPIIGLFLTSLRRKLHPVSFSIIAVTFAGLFCAALFRIYYSRPLIPLVYLAAVTFACPLFVLAVLQFKKTALTLYVFFLVILAIIYYGPSGMRRSFLRDLDRIKDGMTFNEVEKIMTEYSYRKGFLPLDNFSVECLVPDDKKQVPLSARIGHLLAIKSDGSLAAWGRNESGECNVPSGNDYVAVGAGCSYSVALKSDGSLSAWGSNDSGRCEVPTGNNYVAIAAGYSHIVSLKSDGSLVAWGQNDAGQRDVPEGNNFISVAAGGRHSLALRTDGSLVAWGSNDSGQCDVPKGKDFAAIAAGGSHSLALKSNGSMEGWGGMCSGWWDIPPHRNFIAVAAGGSHSVALKSDGSLAAWGNNIYGQCNAPAGKDFVAIAAGYYNSAAVRRNGSLVTWGYTYTTSISGFENQHESELVNGLVLYHYDDDIGNSDVGRVRFRDGRVESVIFWPD